MAKQSEFQSNGFVLLPTFVSAGEMAELRAAAQAVVQESEGTSCARPNNRLVPLSWFDSPTAQILSSAPRIQRLREVLDAPDLRWISGYVSLKEPGSGPLWWHQDRWCWSHPVSFTPEAAQVALLCYLSDTEAANGAVRVLPGTHHRSNYLHSVLPAAHRSGAEALDDRHPAMADAERQATLAVQAGDAVVMDYRLLHGTHANRSNARRDALLLTFTPNWSGLPRDIQSHLVQHPSLPQAGILPPSVPWSDLLPRFDGTLESLELTRDAPEHFSVVLD